MSNKYTDPENLYHSMNSIAQNIKHLDRNDGIVVIVGIVDGVQDFDYKTKEYWKEFGYITQLFDLERCLSAECLEDDVDKVDVFFKREMTFLQRT